MLTDEEFLAGFRDATLDPAHFDHRGHVRAAWLYLAELIARHPIIIENARGLLLRYYSEERLADPSARAVFLPPDRQPLPVD